MLCAPVVKFKLRRAVHRAAAATAQVLDVQCSLRGLRPRKCETKGESEIKREGGEAEGATRLRSLINGIEGVKAVGNESGNALRKHKNQR